MGSENKAVKVKTKMKKIGIGIISVFIFIISWHLIDRFSYSREFSFYPNPPDVDSTLIIGIIGDSWVTGGKLDTILYNDLFGKGLKSTIISSGHPGAKTKLIYQNLFKEENKEYSSKFILEERPNYCIIIAGVNDAASQIGSNFYAYHMILIVKALLHYEITPVIVSLPEFGIEESIDNMNIISKTGSIISARINNKGKIDNITKYRVVFENELRSEKLADSVILIAFDNVCTDYNKCPDIYANSSYLSKKGNEILIQIITNELLRRINVL